MLSLVLACKHKEDRVFFLFVPGNIWYHFLKCGLKTGTREITKIECGSSLKQKKFSSFLFFRSDLSFALIINFASVKKLLSSSPSFLRGWPDLSSWVHLMRAICVWVCACWRRQNVMAIKEDWRSGSTRTWCERKNMFILIAMFAVASRQPEDENVGVFMIL